MFLLTTYQRKYMVTKSLLFHMIKCREGENFLPGKFTKINNYTPLPFFIPHSRSLTVEHLPLLARMVELAKIVLKERRGDPDDVRMGFHLPPFLRVPHLHMHIISPASSMSWLNRNIVFRNDSFAFVSPNGAINHLKKSSK